MWPVDVLQLKYDVELFYCGVRIRREAGSSTELWDIICRHRERIRQSVQVTRRLLPRFRQTDNERE